MTDKEFQEFRQQGIGGSEVAAILGESPYRTPVDVWKDKVLNCQPPLFHAQQRAMEQGKAMEEDILLWSRLPSDANRNIQIVLSNPILRGNIDATYEGGFSYIDNPIIIVEAKTESIKNREKYGQQESFDIPIHYQLQVLHYAFLVQEKYHRRVIIKVPVYFVDRSKETGDEGFVIEKVMYGKVFSAEDRVKTKHVNLEIRQFWEEYIMPKKMPKTYWNKTSVKVEPMDVKTIKMLKETRNKIKALKSDEEKFIGSLAAKYSAQVLFDPQDKEEVLIKRSVINVSRLDYKRLKLENELIYNHYTKESQQTRWTFPKEKAIF